MGEVKLMISRQPKLGIKLDNGNRYTKVIGLMPAFYIGTAFLNFSIGAILGMLMTLNPNWWGLIVSMHAEINPFGWLTILIYGMAYANLRWFANIISPWPKLGWIQLFVAETGVICVVFSHIWSSLLTLQIGMFLQALAPILFLTNILVSIAAKRKREAQEVKLDSNISIYVESLYAAKYHITDAMGRIYKTLGNTKRHYETDSIAQRGTDITLMIFVFAAAYAAISSLFAKNIFSYSIPSSIEVLIYYGWIAGTVSATSLHLYERYSAGSFLQRNISLIGQILWICGVILSAVGFLSWPVIILIGSKLLGLGFVWSSIFYIIPINRVFKGYVQPVHLAWKLSTCWLFLLGAGLLLGLPLMDLVSLHLMFLGWITTLVYGVGYTLFPLLLRRMPRSSLLSIIQVWLSFIGVLLMISGFYCIENGLSPCHPTLLLAIGGVSAASSALYFLIQWPLGKKILMP